MDSALWDAIARVERRHWWFRGRREIVAAALRRRLAPGARVVDVGCGTGFVLERLLEEFDATGLEPDQSVRARAADAVRGRILPGSTDDLSAVPSGSADAVLLLDVLEHLDDDAAALHAVTPLLRPGGFVLMTVPAIPALWSSHDVRNEHRRRYTRGTLRALIRRAGLVPTRVGYFNTRLFPLALVHRTIGRIAGHGSERELAMPPAALNERLFRIFAGEGTHLGRGLPFGLSLLATAEPAPAGGPS